MNFVLVAATFRYVFAVHTVITLVASVALVFSARSFVPLPPASAGEDGGGNRDAESGAEGDAEDGEYHHHGDSGDDSEVLFAETPTATAAAHDTTPLLDPHRSGGGSDTRDGNGDDGSDFSSDDDNGDGDDADDAGAAASGGNV